MPARIVFFGTDEFSAPTLSALIEAGYDVVAVVTKPDSTSGRGREVNEPVVKKIAADHSITVLQPTEFNEDLIKQLGGFNAAAGVVVSYGRIIPQSVIDLFPTGLINIHASLLPKYRGASPIEAAILNGDSETGVSIMQIDAGLDSGPVFTMSKLALNGTVTRPELYDALAKLGAKTLIDTLPQILDGSLKPEPQDDSLATTVSTIKKADGQIDWSQPALQIERQIRAYLGWPGSQARLFDRDLVITKASADSLQKLAPGEVATDNNELWVGTGEGRLQIKRLKPSSKKEMAAAEFIRGLR